MLLAPGYGTAGMQRLSLLPPRCALQAGGGQARRPSRQKSAFTFGRPPLFLRERCESLVGDRGEFYEQVSKLQDHVSLGRLDCLDQLFFA
jgi:hypothetical protein